VVQNSGKGQDWYWTREDDGVPLRCLVPGAKLHLQRRAIYARRENTSGTESVKTILKVTYNEKTGKVAVRLSGVDTVVGGAVRGHGLIELTGRKVRYSVFGASPCARR
jgi:hypothetical protein